MSIRDKVMGFVKSCRYNRKNQERGDLLNITKFSLTKQNVRIEINIYILSIS